MQKVNYKFEIIEQKKNTQTDTDKIVKSHRGLLTSTQSCKSLKEKLITS